MGGKRFRRDDYCAAAGVGCNKTKDTIARMSAAYVMARRGSTNDVAKTLSTTSVDGRAPSRAPVREKAANRSSSPKGSPRRTRLRSPCSSPKNTQRGQAAFETPNLPIVDSSTEQQRLSEAIARRRDQRRRIPVGRGLAA